MIRVLSTNIVSPLGTDTEQNYLAVKAGKSALRTISGWQGLPESITASVFSPEQSEALKVEGYTRFESLAIRSVADALAKAGIEVRGSNTVFILSTTKADVEELSSDQNTDGDYHSPAACAARIAAHFGISTRPIVSCNACISGVAAQILADRLLSCGYYDYAVVCGADCTSAFTAAGFLSFKSLSPLPCRPFDIERLGLNLGEAAATIVFAREQQDSPTEGWRLVRGSMDNDAYHLSAPIPSGEGARKVLERALGDFDRSRLAFISAHGTATMFNDQMESVAIRDAGLSQLPLSALKGWYGHTLGASGVLESIIGMKSVEDGTVLPVRGFCEIGVSGKVNISSELRSTKARAFVKMISGFGGCNASALYSLEPCGDEAKAGGAEAEAGGFELDCSHSVRLTDSSLCIDGKEFEVEARGKELLTEIYRKHIGDYPKFYKMDLLGRLVFLASELLIKQEGETPEASGRAVVLFNHSSSIVADRSHLATIEDRSRFYPSPSVFLYTLPNIVTGEIAIRHGYKAETSLYILEDRDPGLMAQVIRSSFAKSEIRDMVCGWADCSEADCFEADLKIIHKKQ